jgi:hypothetical protein
MPPDKEVEEKALQACFMYLSKNLPPDDVAMEMNSRDLLAPTEHDKYLSMKQAHTSETTKSEYLLQCLGRRRAGFLTRLCEILREIKQASYLEDVIVKAYATASQQGTCRLHDHKIWCLFDSSFLIQRIQYQAQGSVLMIVYQS